ncbi:hypothetical protein QTP86_011235 [Hemibagrus guttatus]|nr:hypothetical protein QTP86_011235 [Hemibagrus guttatus]
MGVAEDTMRAVGGSGSVGRAVGGEEDTVRAVGGAGSLGRAVGGAVGGEEDTLVDDDGDDDGDDDDDDDDDDYDDFDRNDDVDDDVLLIQLVDDDGDDGDDDYDDDDYDDDDYDDDDDDDDDDSCDDDDGDDFDRNDDVDDDGDDDDDDNDDDVDDDDDGGLNVLLCGRKSTTDAIFALRILMEKYRDGQRELHCVFVDLEKAYDRVPREELWYCMRKSGVAEKYVRVVQDMYERSRTVVRCAVGQTEEFNVEVGLHQGSALSPFLFAIVMDQLSEEVRQESPWTMMFADDIVICSESREQVEENLERWRFALERRGIKVSRSKTEYMCVNEREGSGTVRLQGEEVKKVQEFKYLGSTVQSNGECGKEVKKRVQAETVSLRKRQESELEVAELKMLRVNALMEKIKLF